MAKSLRIDNRHESYRPFFQDDFGKRAIEISRDLPELYEIVFDLVADWRGASYSGALVAAIPTALATYHNAREEAPDLTGILKFSDVILQRLSSRLYKIEIDAGYRRLIQNELVAIATEIDFASSTVDLRVRDDALWEQYLDEFSFRSGIHSTMRLVYVSVVASYESFFVRCTRLLTGERVRVNDRNFNEQIRRVFPGIVDSTWHFGPIEMAREIRHAIVHNGGRLTEKLNIAKSRLPVEIEGDEICVWPEHILNLYKLLSEAAWKVIQEVAARTAVSNSETDADKVSTEIEATKD